MIYDLLKKVIEQNESTSPELIRNQTEFFYAAGRLNRREYREIVARLTS